MPPPRPSYSAEAARAAAAQAEFNEKKWVWVPDDKEGYLSGWVMSEDGEYGDVMMASGSEVSSLDFFAESGRKNEFAHQAFVCCVDAPCAPVCSFKDESAQIR